MGDVAPLGYPVARVIADRHYNRQHIGAEGFVPPGRCLVLYTQGALWVTSWPFAEYTKHAWAGAWVNCLFRNEGAGLSSDLIRTAVAATRWRWPAIPALGMVTFVDQTQVRHKRDPGRCYRKAGFTNRCGCGCVRDPKKKRDKTLCCKCGGTGIMMTDGGLLAFQLLPQDMPEPYMPMGAQVRLFDE